MKDIYQKTLERWSKEFEEAENKFIKVVVADYKKGEESLSKLQTLRLSSDERYDEEFDTIHTYASMCNTLNLIKDSNFQSYFTPKCGLEQSYTTTFKTENGDYRVTTCVFNADVIRELSNAQESYGPHTLK